MEDSLKPLMELIPVLLPLAVALVAALVIVALSRRLRGRITRKRPQQEREIRLVVAVLRNLILLIVFLGLLEAINVPLGNLWTAISTIIALVAIGFFAVWSVLSHMTAAVILFLQRPFRQGQQLQLGDEDYAGIVVKVGLFYTVVEDSERGRSLIPNNLLFQKRFRVTSPGEDSDARSA